MSLKTRLSVVLLTVLLVLVCLLAAPSESHPGDDDIQVAGRAWVIGGGVRLA